MLRAEHGTNQYSQPRVSQYLPIESDWLSSYCFQVIWIAYFVLVGSNVSGRYDKGITVPSLGLGSKNEYQIADRRHQLDTHTQIYSRYDNEMGIRCVLNGKTW